MCPTFSLVNALVYVRHRPGQSLGKKQYKHLKCSPRSWLDDFTQPFSWRSSLSRALDFQNKLFLLGVKYLLDIGFVGFTRLCSRFGQISNSLNVYIEGFINFIIINIVIDSAQMIFGKIFFFVKLFWIQI